MDRKPDRRKILHPVVVERRTGRERRMICPQCSSPLLSNAHKNQVFSLRSFVCTNAGCNYTWSSRQLPAGKPGLQPFYILTMRSTFRSLMLELPGEFCDLTGIDSKSKLILKMESAKKWVIEKT
jgi:hypothetical protein